MSKHNLPLRLSDDALDEDFADLVETGRRARPPRVFRQPKPRRPTPALPREPLPVAAGLRIEGGVNATSEERAWLAEQLDRFYFSKTLTAVLRRVKGGKEANVYCCAAHPETGLNLVAAKVYRPRLLRNLRNDGQYREGRPLLDAQGHPIDPRDWRMQKAVAGKSRTGLEAQQASWVAYEFQTMLNLHAAGADVPRPLRNTDHAILMEYVGDAALPAPALIEVGLAPDEARRLFDRLVGNIELMLAAHVVHGDLSAYNVLYWQGEIKIIDLPQVVDPRQNSRAYHIFRRDVERVCQYFARYGVPSQPGRLARDLWHKHVPRRPALRPERSQEF